MGHRPVWWKQLRWFSLPSCRSLFPEHLIDQLFPFHPLFLNIALLQAQRSNPIPYLVPPDSPSYPVCLPFSYFFLICSQRRSYEFPSITKLFPEIRTINKIRGHAKRTNQAIASFREQFLRRYIVNLSIYYLSPQEEEILLKGLKFVPSPQSNPRKIFDNAITQTRALYNKHKVFKDATTAPRVRPHPFKVRSFWSAPHNQSPPNTETQKSPVFVMETSFLLHDSVRLNW